MTILDEVSPYRASFTHPKMYPGNGACRKIFKLAKEFEQILRSENIYPTVLRITREISDEYGRGYAKGIDESDNIWTIYTGEWLDPERQYFMYSKTNPIAVHPVLVQKI